MRTEKQMLDLIVDTARNDERVRVVIMNGSRANPNAPRDPFQDFDIIYLVKEVAPFKDEQQWIGPFGDLMVLQMPDDMLDPPPGSQEGFTYLMQFTDGNRIDLGIYPQSKLADRCMDSLSVLLLDKDGMVGYLPPPSEADYLPKAPDWKAFADCCNEFWWVCPYIAKGLWRQEIIYAKYMFDQVLRDQLRKMMVWFIGMNTGFSRNPGKMGKYFQRYLDSEHWEMLLKTYSGASYEDTWDALYATCDLFRRIAVPVASHFGFEYPRGDDRRVSAHLARVRHLPGDAKMIY